MTRLRPTLAAALAALLLAAPAAAARPSQTTALELARAQERTYMQELDANRIPPRTASASHGGPSTALLAGFSAGALLLTAAAGLATIRAHRRHAHNAAASAASPQAR